MRSDGDGILFDIVHAVPPTIAVGVGADFISGLRPDRVSMG
jgi:hypothetical protein